MPLSPDLAGSSTTSTVAAPATAAYGRLSVLTQWTCTAHIALRIPPEAFTPPPKVWSVVVSLLPHAEQPPPDLFVRMERLTAAAFGQRRKMLKGALRSLVADPGALLTILAGITLIFTNKTYYLHAGWLHFKLLIVVALIILHGYIGIEMKGVQKGTSSLTSGKAWFLFATVLVVFLAILIVTLPGEVYLPH